MDVNLRKETIRFSESMQEKTSAVYAEGDVIVPDNAPDIRKILQIDGRARIGSCDRQDDKMMITGTAEFCILYLPEDDMYGAPVRSIHTSVPFKDVCTMRTAAEHARASVTADMTRIESMLLNSRKLSVKGSVTLSVREWQEAEEAIATAAEADCELAVKTRRIAVQSIAADDVFSVTVADKLDVPKEKPAAGEILKMDAAVLGLDTRVITNKVIIKGAVRLRTLYLAAGTAPSVQFMEHDLPFTEILDLPGAAEGMESSLDIDIDNIYFETDDTESGARAVGAEITLTVRAEVLQCGELSVLDDLYAPHYDTHLTKKTCRTGSAADTLSDQLAAKKSITLPSECPKIREIYNIVGRPRITSAAVQGGMAELEGMVDIYILYLTDDSEMPLFCYQDSVPFAFAGETKAPSTASCATKIALLGCGFTLTGAESVDVRANLDLTVSLQTEDMVEVIDAVTLAEEEAAERASIIIAFVNEGDTLWNLAKKYKTTASRIAEANGIEEDAGLSCGMKLFIP